MVKLEQSVQEMRSLWLGLNDSQRQIAAMYAHGDTYKDIAYKTFKQYQTVKNIMTGVYRSFGWDKVQTSKKLKLCLLVYALERHYL